MTLILTKEGRPVLTARTEAEWHVEAVVRYEGENSLLKTSPAKADGAFMAWLFEAAARLHGLQLGGDFQSLRPVDSITP